MRISDWSSDVCSSDLEVRVTLRLVDSPACVVVGQNELSPNLLRMLKAAGQEAPDVKPVLEINPEHALIARVRDAEDAEFEQWARLLLDQARSEEHTSELQSLMRNSYAVFCLKKKNKRSANTEHDVNYYGVRTLDRRLQHQ